MIAVFCIVSFQSEESSNASYASKGNGIAVSCIFQSHGSPARTHEYRCQDKKHNLFESTQGNAFDANVSEDTPHSAVTESLLKSIDGYPPAGTDPHERSQSVYLADHSVDTMYPK
jgi:hypothetical protein